MAHINVITVHRAHGIRTAVELQSMFDIGFGATHFWVCQAACYGTIMGPVCMGLLAWDQVTAEQVT